MKLIVGLGNVGPEFSKTRHNVGFMVLTDLAVRHDVSLRRRHVKGRTLLASYGDWKADGSSGRLMLPQTMMNASGDALGALADWRVALRDILLVCDDVNLPLGTLRLRAHGNAGGHHGLASCLEVLATPQVARLRVGVGGQPLPRDLTEFVLSPFLREERPIIRRALARAEEACALWVREGTDRAMNAVNSQHP